MVLVAGEDVSGLEALNLQHVHSPGAVVWVRDLDHPHCRSDLISGLPHVYPAADFGCKVDRIRNTAINAKTGLPHIQEIIDARRTAFFGHVARLGDRVPANRSLKLAVDISFGRGVPSSWKRPRRRPRDTWLKPLQRLSGSILDQ